MPQEDFCLLFNQHLFPFHIRYILASWIWPALVNLLPYPQTTVSVQRHFIGNRIDFSLILCR